MPHCTSLTKIPHFQYYIVLVLFTEAFPFVFRTNAHTQGGTHNTIAIVIALKKQNIWCATHL